MKLLLTFIFLVTIISLRAQKREEGFDAVFRPTQYAPRFFVITEKDGERWHRTAYYLPEKSMAMDAWYQDEACKTPDGEYRYYHSNRVLKHLRTYKNGKKDGTWMAFNETGMVVDSAIYANGHQKGVRMQWSNDGLMVDSSFYDGAGNGTEVSWDNEGNLYSAGFIVSDTAKNKRWQYFYPNGKPIMIEDYDNGKRIAFTCFDVNGNRLENCIETEAEFSGGEKLMRSFVEKNLNGDVPVRRKAPEGVYTVYVDFTIDTSGKLINVKPLTNFGFGMEEEVIRMLKKQPLWKPAVRFGQKVNAYRRQPVTFQVTK